MSEPTLSPITVSGKFDKMGESLKALRDYAVQAAEIAGLPKSRIEGLRMAVDEYATNIITYGYRDAGLMGNIDAEATIDPNFLIVSLYDNAAAFDPTAHDDPTNLEDDLVDRPIGGLGIMLAKQSVDEWRYERVGNQNCNHFVLKRS
jgi:anti-sigma regulatory factor (Ser/Thr protein kinase)